jgi:hypothetical protein
MALIFVKPVSFIGFNKSSKYNFTEMNQVNGTIAANADMEDADNVAVGVKSFDEYVFKIYIWD